ncbi:MAG: hypothetical protein AMK69_00440 [Nitrospira bacterium SG8_3]|nr:MAG: hypothetical protein AMK69_00440 [Nitrospira bacterium SG8_3]
MPDEFVEKRSEPRDIVDKFYSVEFSLKGIDFVYQFKIWNMSSKGMCVLIKEDSAVLKHLKAGDVMDMKYYSSDALSPTEHLQTEIRHITKDEEGRFKGHVLVGLSILGNKESTPYELTP